MNTKYDTCIVPSTVLNEYISPPDCVYTNMCRSSRVGTIMTRFSTDESLLDIHLHRPIFRCTFAFKPSIFVSRMYNATPLFDVFYLYVTTDF
jgi:hypothetical protein